MIKDFVPARTNVLTGVTIKSPILERNKIPQYKPKVSEDNNFEADYLTANISEDNEYLYDKLGGDKSSFYTGEIDGTNIDVYEYFEFAATAKHTPTHTTVSGSLSALGQSI